MTDLKNADYRTQVIASIVQTAATRKPVWLEERCRRTEQRIARWEADFTEALVKACASPYQTITHTFDQWVNALGNDLLMVRLVRDEKPLARPARKMPTLRKIAAAHDLGDEPYCVRCSALSSAETWDQSSGCPPFLERAHIIDRWAGGTDYPANIAPLCSACHLGQPVFVPGDEAVAYDWFGLPDPYAAVRAGGWSA